MFIIKNTGITVAVMLSMGMISISKHTRFYGWEKEDTLFIALIMGLIIGIITSLLGWVIHNDRYAQIKKKKENEF